MFVINPDPYSLPSYRIGPFTTKDISTNHKIFRGSQSGVTLVKEYLHKRFRDIYQFTYNGREGINLALKAYKLESHDLVSIITTSQNFYISSCVTKEIEKFCQWNRVLTHETKIILVNHEFGTVYPEMENLVATGIPIIEDCCTTFFSQDEQNRVGKYGDFAVYSFSKFFPIQIGGLLVSNKNKTVSNSTLDEQTKLYIEKVLSYQLKENAKLLNKRNSIYTYALNQYRKLGFTNFFGLHPLQVPSVMMLKNNGVIKDLPALKNHLWKHGIQSSVFYGEDAFFIPSHQNLSKIDVLYFFEIIRNFIKIQ